MTPEATCEACGGEMERKRSTRRYCSNACRQRSYRQRGQSERYDKGESRHDVTAAVDWDCDEWGNPW